MSECRPCTSIQTDLSGVDRQPCRDGAEMGQGPGRAAPREYNQPLDVDPGTGFNSQTTGPTASVKSTVGGTRLLQPTEINDEHSDDDRPNISSYRATPEATSRPPDDHAHGASGRAGVRATLV